MRLLGGLVVIGVVSGELGVCDNERRIQLLLVHDGSANYRSVFLSLATNTKKFMDRLAEEWGPTGIQLGLSAFVDKNMPFRGWGDCCGVGEMDYCYMHHTGPTVDIEALRRGFGDMAYYVGSGGDYPENPYEGMIASVRDSRNRMEEPGFAEDGKEVFRIMIMVTDEIPQEGGTGQEGITKFNAKPDPKTQMGYWHVDFHKQGALYGRDSSHPLAEEYAEMLALKEKDDATMTETEKKRFDSLYKHWGPDTFDNLIDPHPATTDAAENCNKYVYPTAEQVVEGLIEYKVTPHFLFGSSQKITPAVVKACNSIGHTIGSDKKKYQECLREFYPLKMREAGYLAEDMVTYAFNGDPREWTHLADAILSVLKPLSKPIPCDPELDDSTAVATEPTTLPSTLPTTTLEVTIPTSQTSMPSIGWPLIPIRPPIWWDTTTKPVVIPPSGESTTSQGPSGESTTSQGEAVIPSISFTTTTQGGGVVPTLSTDTTKSPGGNGGDSTTTTTTTTTEEEGGSNIGVIAGATGGALAALGALGLLAYKKLGGALMGGGGHPSLAQDTEQVEVDESPVERETLEEVTMDMFQ